MTNEGEPSKQDETRLPERFLALVRAIVRADEDAIQIAALNLGNHATWLAPFAWAASGIGFAVTGVIFLARHWQLVLFEIPPAGWVWLATWNLKSHIIEGSTVHHHSFQVEVLLVIVLYLGTILAFWCNVVFGFAVTQSGSIRIRDAIRDSRTAIRPVIIAGLAVGTPIAIVSSVASKFGSFWYLVILTGATVIMIFTFVFVPARVLGAEKQKMDVKGRLGYWFISGVMSAMAVGPGFIIARIGLLMIGFHSLRIPGFFTMTIGAGLYAAGMSSVKALKLTARLSVSPRQSAKSPPS